MASSSSSRQRSYDSLASSASMQSSDSSAKRIRLEPAHFDDDEAHGTLATANPPGHESPPATPAPS